MRTCLKKRREELGYTQKGFAKAIGMSKSGYTHIEQGLRFPREKNMKLIMGILKYNDVKLFDNEIMRNSGENISSHES